jgi:hypothetical protein
MKRSKIIGMIAQVALLAILFGLIEWVSGDQTAAGAALITSFLCGFLFKYAGDYKRNLIHSKNNIPENKRKHEIE